MKKHILVFIAALLICSTFTATAQKTKILSMDSLIAKEGVWVQPFPKAFKDNNDGTVSVNIAANRSDPANVPLDCTPTQNFSNIDRKYNKSNGSLIGNTCMQFSDSLGRVLFSYPQSNGDIINIGNYLSNAAIERRDANHNLLWLKHYGSSKNESVADVALADDGDVGFHYGGAFDPDNWVLKLDSMGDMQWGCVLGGTGWDVSRTILPTDDGGCCIFSIAGSFDYDMATNKGSTDLFIAKIDSLGNKVWTKCYGGSNADGGGTDNNIFALPDDWGGFYILNRTNSNDGDVQNKTDNSADYWLLHIDKDGNILWERNYGGSDIEMPSAMCRGANGNIWIGGSMSYIFEDTDKGDVLEWFGGGDVWILQVDTNGNIVNQRTLGTNQLEELRGLYPFDDGTVLAVGRYFQTSPPAGKRSPGFPITVVRLNSNKVFIAHLSPETALSITDKKNSISDWQIFPNPTDGKFSIKVQGNIKKYKIKITDIKGRELYTGWLQNNQIQLNTQTWAKGNYIITLTDNKGNTDSKQLTIK